MGSRDPSLDDRLAREIEDLRERAERAERERDQAQRALTNYGWTKCCEFFRGSAYGR